MLRFRSLLHGPLNSRLEPIAWAWVPAFLVLRLTETHSSGFHAAFAAALGAALIAHRHLTLFHVLTDRAARARVFSRRRAWLPVLGAVLVSILAARVLAEGVSEGSRRVLAVLAAVAVAWNLWHVLMQRYGFIRLIAGGRGSRLADFLVLLSWVSLVPLFADFRGFEILGGEIWSSPMARWGAPIEARAAAVALVAGSHAFWLWREHRDLRLADPRRLSWVLSTACFFLGLLWLPPAPWVLAFLFGHALEYVIFVRSRSRVPGRAFAAFLGVVFVVFLAWKPQGEVARVLLVLWVLAEGLLHFYWDALLWKRAGGTEPVTSVQEPSS